MSARRLRPEQPSAKARTLRRAATSRRFEPRPRPRVQPPRLSRRRRRPVRRTPAPRSRRSSRDRSVQMGYGGVKPLQQILGSLSTSPGFELIRRLGALCARNRAPQQPRIVSALLGELFPRRGLRHTAQAAGGAGVGRGELVRAHRLGPPGAGVAHRPQHTLTVHVDVAVWNHPRAHVVVSRVGEVSSTTAATAARLAAPACAAWRGLDSESYDGGPSASNRALNLVPKRAVGPTGRATPTRSCLTSGGSLEKSGCGATEVRMSRGRGFSVAVRV